MHLPSNFLYLISYSHQFCSEFKVHALGALAEVAGPGLNFHLNTILPALLSAMGDDSVVNGISSILSLPFHLF